MPQTIIDKPTDPRTRIPGVVKSKPTSTPKPDPVSSFDIAKSATSTTTATPSKPTLSFGIETQNPISQVTQPKVYDTSKSVMEKRPDYATPAKVYDTSKSVMEKRPDYATPRDQAIQSYLDEGEPENKYDLQRQQATAQHGDEVDRGIETLERQMAGQGFGKGSGLLEGQEREFNVDAQNALATRLGMIDVEELQAKESREESALDREVSYAGLDIQSQQLAEQSRQFDSKDEFDRWATAGGWEQNDIDRAWKAEENYQDRLVSYAGLTVEEKRLAEDARQFDSKEDFDTWALQEGWNQDSIDRAWQGNENYLDRVNSRELIELKGQVEQDTIRFEKGLQTQLDSFYYKGLAGIELTESERDGLDQINLDAYESGLAKVAYDDYTSDRDATIEARKALITSLDPADKNFIEDLTDIYTAMGVDMPESLTSYIEENQIPDAAESFNFTSKTNDGGYAGGSYEEFTDAVPSKGETITLDGVDYEVTSSVEVEGGGLLDSGTGYEYFFAKNMENGDIVGVRAGEGLINAEKIGSGKSTLDEILEASDYVQLPSEIVKSKVLDGVTDYLTGG